MTEEGGFKQRTLRGVAYPALLVGAMLAFGSGAYAQNAPAAQDQTSTVETVVVTAQKREEDVSKVPVTVQALSGAALERQGVNNVKDLINLVPNASLSGESSQGTEVYQLRGIVTGDTNGDATVASYLDDFAYSIPGVPYAPPADLYDLNRVEVLKGPQGTLYGASSMGGVLKLVTNDPDLNNFNVTMLGSVGQMYEHGLDYSGNVMVNAPIIRDKLAIRAVLSGKHLSGFSYIPFLNYKDANKADVILGRVKVLFQPTDKLSILASAWRYEVHQDWTNRLDDNNPPLDISYGPGSAPTDYNLYTLRVNYDLGWADLVSASGYLRRNYIIILKGCQSQLCYDLKTHSPTNAFHQEIRLASKGQGPLQWVGGLFYMDADNQGYVDFNITPPLVPTPTQSPPLYIQSTSDIKSREIAAFGEVSYDLFGGKVRPLLGLRYSAVKRERQEESIVLYGGPGGIPISNVNEGSDASSYHVSPRFNISYFPTDEGMLYANVAEGYRPGTLQTASQVAGLEAVLGVQTSEHLQTDSLWSYEVGGKWAFLDRTVNVSLSVYKIRWDRAQLQTGLSGVSGVLNVGDIDGKGVDFMISQRTPIPGLRWQFAAGWNDTKLQNIEPSILARLHYLHNGMQVPPVPKRSATFMVNYEHPTSYYDLTMIADASYSYRSDERDLSTGISADALNIVNADLGFRKDNITALLYADNLTNENGPTIWEQGRIIMPRPRVVGVRLSFNGF